MSDSIMPEYSDGAAVIVLPDFNYYIEKRVAGLDRRVFRYENSSIGAHLEFAYYDEWSKSGRVRWYGFAGRELPQSILDIL